MNTKSISRVSRFTDLISTVNSKAVHLLSAFVLGAVVIYGAGFLQKSVAHNAAHDMRHSQGFPCH